MKYKQEIKFGFLVQKPKHGYSLFSVFNQISPLLFQNFVGGIFGVGVGIAALYISWRGVKTLPWVSDRRNSSRTITVAGLQNLGNNCFLNVILQALSSSSHFLPFLQQILINYPFIEEKDERMPLTADLTSLLEELCIIREERTVLNPRKVMFAMTQYVSSFSLTRQQDAAEAFFHLLSSLEEEITQCYVPHSGSLVDLTTSPSKIHDPEREGQKEYERWQQQIFGPFDGINGSILSCTNCSSTLSMDFEFFRCLPVSPVLDGTPDTMKACSLVDCLKHFTAVELIENYRCHHCWHIAALKYASLQTEKNEAKIKMLTQCAKLDSCDCKELFLPEEITWTGFSCVLKQLRIARCPKVLCIHLQRASMNINCELIKLQGHISFPLSLDVFPFTEGAATVGQVTSENYMRNQRNRQRRTFAIELAHLNMQLLPHLYRVMGESLPMESISSDRLGGCVGEQSGHTSIGSGNCDGDVVLGCKKVASDLCPQSYSTEEGESDKKIPVNTTTSAEGHLYCLSAVVEHYGRPGSGHYAVYKRAAPEPGPDNAEPPSESQNSQWFYVSDREVLNVSEETVLAAEASLLFYEKI